MSHSSAFKNTGFFQRTKFNFQHPQGNAQLPITSVSGLPLWLLRVLQAWSAQSHRHVKHPHEKLSFKTVTEIALEVECEPKG